MITRTVTIEQEGAFWLVHIDDTSGLTQARRYSEVELMAREYIALAEDVPIENVSITKINVTGASDELAQAAAERRQAHELEDAANKNP